MAMFTGYFDDSGTHRDSLAAVVAGYISTVAQWDRLDCEWHDVLHDAGIEFFHMAEYESRKGPYKDWNDSKRKRVLERLILIIKRRAQIPIGVSVIPSDYQEVLGTAKKLSPYSFCALTCIAHVRQWADRYNHHEPIAYVFEDGTCGASELHRMKRDLSRNEPERKHYQFDSLIFQDKKARGALQAADILAYELHKEMKNYIVPGKRLKDPRYSGIELLHGQPIDFCVHYAKERLRSSFAKT